MSKKLSQAALKKACSRHNWALQWCWNYEKMQAAGYAYAMVPIVKELYDGEEEQCRQLERHMQFYNTHPGAILASTLPVLALFILRWPLFNYGYRQGANVINDVSGAGTIDKLQVGAQVLGVTVLGGFIPSMIPTTFPVKLGTDLVIDGEIIKEAPTLQSALDAIFPYLVPIAITFGCYYLIKYRKMSPLRLIILLFFIGFVLGALGWMA